MVTASTLRRGLKYVYGVCLALYLGAPAYAFQPAQVPLLSASAITPNLMLLVDNSGSMYNIIWASGFDPTITTRPAITYYQLYRCGGNTCARDVAIQGDDTLTLSSAWSTNSCSSAYTYVQRNGTVYCLLLPDPASKESSTRYTADYLSYLVDLTIAAGNNRTKDFTTGIVPNDFRINVARSVATTLVTNNSNQTSPTLRIGLAGFNSPSDDDSGPGGKITKEITDLSAVAKTTYQDAVSQNTATANSTALKTAIAALRGDSNTPLAETYYEITRYFRGLTPYYNSTPATYKSPIQYRCQKNFGVVITDGLPTYDRSFPTDDVDDVADTSRSLPNWDLNAANDGANLQGNGEGDTLYLDDLAKFAYDIDMRKASNTPGTDLTGKSWDSPGFNKQNMSTYTIGFTAANQMLIDAADETHGRGKYFTTNDAAGLTAALNLALSDIYSKAGSGGGGATNSSTLTDGTRFYQTLYDPADWHGTIKAYNLDTTTGALTTSFWNTDTTIVAGRTGTTYESWNTSGSGAKIVLDYANFASEQQTALNATLPTGVTGPNLIDWTKGNANAKLRTRTKLLGDIINSPLAPASPNDKTAVDLVGDTSYTTYLATKASNMNYNLLLNTNDGFFNAVNPADGTRRYAYMPSTSLASLSAIAATTYGTGAHKFTVDGQISVFDTKVGSAWRTVAFGGLGAGGKALFAVKLFEGTSNTIGALWEIKAPDSNNILNVFNNLGYTYSKPDVAQMSDGTGIVVVGNGYGSFSGRASLFVLNASTGALIREIQVPLINNETDNGLSSVKLRVNAQNVVQAAYAGDLKGRLWKFDLSSTAALGWTVAYSGKPLFTTPGGATQPITVQPILIDHPTNGKLVYFGTGKFSETADKTTTDQQAFYAIWDKDGAVGDLTQSSLVAQTIDANSITGNGNTYFTTSSNTVDWATKRGWYMQLATGAPYPGERIIYPSQTSRGRIIFTTASVNSVDPCESTGTGRLFELDAVTGSMLAYQVLDTNGDNDVTTADTRVSGLAFGAGIPNLASIVAGTGGANDNKYVIDSSGGTATKLLEKGGSANLYQRIMWRQIQ